MSNESERDRPVIEATPAMIEAGCIELWCQIGDGLTQSGISEDLKPIVKAIVSAAVTGRVELS